MSQWFLDPLNKKGPDFERNKDRILDKINSVDATFLTTCPSALSFIPKNKCFYIPNPADKSFETLNNFHKSCNVDVFFALSHGVFGTEPGFFFTHSGSGNHLIDEYLL